MLQQVEITGLDPGTIYRFRFGNDSKSYLFETMSADIDEPLSFGTGGDTGHGESFRQMNRGVLVNEHQSSGCIPSDLTLHIFRAESVCTVFRQEILNNRRQ